MELAAHAASWAVVLVSATIWIPRAGKMFQDFGVESSSLSALVIQMAQPLVMSIVCAIVLAVDGIIYSSLWRSEVSRTVRNRFSLFMTLVPLLIMLVFGTTIYLPLLKQLG
jgi:type II secretory pathway component PulF